MTATTTARRFPLWDPIRGVGALAAGYVGVYNIFHTVNHHQWVYPLIMVAAGLATTIFEGIYDTPMPGGFFGPTDMQNVTCMMISIGLPAVAFVSGLVHGSWHWWVAGLVVLVLNSLLYFGFRQRGLTALIVTLCLLGLLIF